MRPEPFRIVRIRRELSDTFTLELEPRNGGQVKEWRPGQFNMIYAFGIGESALSISGDSDQRSSYIHTIRAVGRVTRSLERLKRGDVVGLRGPFGQGWPDAAGKDLIIIAGGIGLAPLRPVIYRVLKSRAAYGRVLILYGARSPGDLMYRNEIESWRGRLDLGFEVTVDTAPSSWRGNIGVVTALIPGSGWQDGQAMICGPEVMMRFSVQALQRMGMSDDRIFISMERNLSCAIGHCGHCQYGPHFICKDGPVLSFDRVAHYFNIREV